MNALDFTGIVREIVKEELKETAYKIGIITSIVSGKPRIMFDGETVASGKGYSFIQNYAPNIGDRVLLSRISGTYIITGKIVTDVSEASGEFTPAFGSSNNDGTATYGTKYGYYVKIGKLVYINIRMDGVGYSGGTGYFMVKSLPFAADTKDRMNFITGQSNITNIGNAWSVNSKNIYLRTWNSPGAIEVYDVTGCYVHASGVYQIG